MLKFNKCNATAAKLDQWVKLEANVLLIGEKGVGKTQRVTECFTRNKLKYAYFSGATLDPWIHLIGIPKVKLIEGKEKMDFILPSNLDDDIEALFIDEYNRCHKLVKNALLELQQFKSINGRKFPKLKMIWAAINPPKDEADDSQDYDVEELDPAQLDRFHVIVELPNMPDQRYFNNKFGDHQSKILIDWWKDQSAESKKILSPRRLDYLGDFFKKGGDLFDLLPSSANTKDLISKLSTKKEDVILNTVFNNPTDEVMKVFLSVEDNYLKYRDKLNSPQYWRFHKHLKQELLCAHIKESEEFKNFAVLQYLKKDMIYQNAITEVSKSTKDNGILKLAKLLEAQNLDLSKFESTIANAGTLKTKLAIGNKDTFSSDPDAAAVTGQHIKKLDFTLFKGVQTATRVKLLIELLGSWNSVPNHYDVINFTMTTIGSFQATTFAKYTKQLLPLIGSTLALCKGKLNDVEIKTIRQQFHINKAKFEEAQFNEFIGYLRDGGDGSDTSILTDEFTRKINEANMLIALTSKV